MEKVVRPMRTLGDFRGNPVGVRTSVYRRLMKKGPFRPGMMCAVALFALLAPGVSQAQGSLFPLDAADASLKSSSATTRASLYSDAKARQVGDILTIDINETFNSSVQANTKASKSEDVSGFAGTGLFQRIFKEFPFTASNSRNANGAGSSSRTGTFTAIISVTIREILPNGVFRIEGTRSVGVNKETQRVTFSGIVRPEDITPENTVPSEKIADVHTVYEGKGMVGDTQRPGILTRVFRVLF